MQANYVIYNEEYLLIKDAIYRLKQGAKAKVVFVADSEGHCIASMGDIDDVNLNSISSLIAGSVAAINSIAQMLKIDNFHSILNESGQENLYISFINAQTILVVVFDQGSNLGLVRFRVREAREELEMIFRKIVEKIHSSEQDSGMSPFDGVTDEDIDRIFGD